MWEKPRRYDVICVRDKPRVWRGITLVTGALDNPSKDMFSECGISLVYGAG